jgi:hypothetical protein
MDKQRESRAPLIVVIVLLLLPVLYVGTYFALVVPGSALIPVTGSSGESGFLVRHYRWGGDSAERVFWPLEQIDRKLRPKAWEKVEILPLDYRVGPISP